MQFSREYLVAVALLLGATLKVFGIELEDSAVEGLVVGVGALLIAIFRKKKGDINIFGARIQN